MGCTLTLAVVRSLQFAVGTVSLETAGHSESRDGAQWVDKLRAFWIDLCCLFPNQSRGSVWYSVQTGFEFRWRHHLSAAPSLRSRACPACLYWSPVAAGPGVLKPAWVMLQSRSTLDHVVQVTGLSDYLLIIPALCIKNLGFICDTVLVAVNCWVV